MSLIKMRMMIHTEGALMRRSLVWMMRGELLVFFVITCFVLRGQCSTEVEHETGFCETIRVQALTSSSQRKRSL